MSPLYYALLYIMTYVYVYCVSPLICTRVTLLFLYTLTNIHHLSPNSHTAIVEEGRLSGFLTEFASEQKVLTDLLLRGQYNLPIFATILPADQFPSGTVFFNQNSHGFTLPHNRDPHSTAQTHAQAMGVGAVVPVPVVSRSYEASLVRLTRHHDLHTAAAVTTVIVLAGIVRGEKDAHPLHKPVQYYADFPSAL